MSLLAKTVSELSPKQRALFEKLVKRERLDISQLPIVQQPRDTNTFPLSFSQQRMWLLQQIEPESTAYNCVAALRLIGELSITALQQTLKELVRRHEALRTTFVIVNGHPLQSIAVDMDIPLQCLKMGSQPELLQSVITKEARQPFDLAQGPLLRIKLLCLEQDDYVLVVAMHHIISDGWSMKILIREMMELYTAYVTRRSVALPAPSIQYADYAVWQREWLRGDRLASQLAYWKDRLADVPALLSLPADRPRPSVQSYRGAFQPFTLPTELSEALRALSRSEGVTVFMTLLAAFDVLLFRYTNQEDILVGTPIANRKRAETENVIGCFINTLVLRNTLSNELNFRQLLAQVRETTLSAYANQDLPFEQLVETLRIKRDPGYTPLIQVFFVFQNIKMDALELPGLSISPFEIEKGTAQFDLTLEIVEETGKLSGQIEYNTDLFETATISRMIEHFKVVLQAVVVEAEQTLATLPLLGENETRQILLEWNKTQVSYPQQDCLHAHIERQVEKTPDAIALVFEEMQLSYDVLNRRANQLAHSLQTMEVGPDVLVGVCMHRSLEMVIALLGILKAGGAYVPLDPSYPPERLGFMLQDAQVSVLLTQAALQEQLPSHCAQTLCLDSDWPRISLYPDVNPGSQVEADHLAYVIYTSGSTGLPKGAMNTHRGIGNRLLWMQQAYCLTADDTLLQKTPFGFDVSVWEFFWPLLSGARLVMARPGGHRDSTYLVNVITEQGITTLHFVPSLLRIFLAEPALEQCISLRQVMCSGEALTPDCQDLFFARLQCRLHNLYGPTEASVDVTFWECERDSQLPAVPIGHPIANIQMYILDKHLQPVPIGVPGELYIGGVGLARGYYRHPALTAERFIPHPFSVHGGDRLYRTGDLAYYLSNGVIEYLGRLDYQIKLRGYRIELGEIEAILGQHPAVRECLVMAREDIPGEKRLVAYLIPVAEEVPSNNEFRSYLAARLPDYMLPAAFVSLHSWPLSPNGKVDRRALPVPDHERPNLQTPFVAPRTPTEQALAAIWQELLGLQQVGIHDNFFESGGHSLLAIQLVSQIRERLGQYLSLSIVFQKPTIEAMARLLSHQAGMISWSPLVAIQPHGSRTPLFCVHQAPGNVFSYADLAQCLGPDQPFYGLQARGIDGQLAPLATIEEMAAAYIQEIRTVQPEGPYMLGGHSLGGLVVFEMAQQLYRRGEEVALLAIMDRPAPVLKKSASQPSSDGEEQEETAHLMTEFISIMSQLSGKEIVVSYETLQHMELGDQLEYIRRQMQISGLLSDKADIRPIQGLYQVQKAGRRAVTAYVPSVYEGHGHVAIFATEQALRSDYNEDQHTLYPDESLGWDALVPQGVQTYRVPGNHISMLVPPQVQVVAEQLRHCLDQAQEKMRL